MIEVAQIIFGEVCWTFYRCTKILTAQFLKLQFFASRSRELYNILWALGFCPRHPANSMTFCEIVSSQYFSKRFLDIPRGTCKLSLIFQHIVFVLEIPQNPSASLEIPFYYPRYIIQVSLSTSLREYAWKSFRMLVIDNSNSRITLNTTCHEILPIT